MQSFQKIVDVSGDAEGVGHSAMQSHLPCKSTGKITLAPVTVQAHSSGSTGAMLPVSKLYAPSQKATLSWSFRHEYFGLVYGGDFSLV